MLADSGKRAELTRGVVASGMILVGLAAGSNPFFALLIGASVSVGSSLLGNVVDRALGSWRSNWLGAKGVLNDPIRQALNQAYVKAVQQLESDWKKHPHYNYLLRSNERERAMASLDVLRELRDDANQLFQDPNELSTTLQHKQIFPSSKEQPTENTVRQVLNRTLDEYLGLIEPLAELAKDQLADSWLLFFGDIIKTDQGTAAWRACQELWQASVTAGVAELQQTASQTQVNIEELQQSVTVLHDWLDEWGEQLKALPATARDSTGQEAFDKEVLKPRFEILQAKLAAVHADTQLIKELLKSRFNELNFNDVMLDFLRKQLIDDQYVNLEQAGHESQAEDIPLAKVFVDLPASDKYSAEPLDEGKFVARSADGRDTKRHQSGRFPPGIIAEILEVADYPLDPESLRIEATSGREGARLYILPKRKRGRFVLVGGPGQGKTTTSQFICQLFRAATLRSRSDAIRSEQVRRALLEIEDLCRQENIHLPSVPRIPFRITLNDFAAKLASPRDEGVSTLLSYIAHRISKRTGREVSPDHLRQWLSDYPWAIILDGLDEVPATSNRDEVLSAVQDFWIDAEESNADVLLVATTRPQGYGEEFATNTYTHKWLTPLSKVRAKHYAERLVRLRYRQEERRECILSRLNTALRDESTARLMRSPLQVTIMTALVDKIGKPPQERWSLFQRYYDAIFEREMERDIPAATILRDYRPDINAIHHRVGLLLQIESEQSGQTGAHLSLDRFASLVQARLAEEGHEGKNAARLKQRIIEAATTRLVFLVEVEAGEIGFEIRSLQEFMAAEALMQGGDDLVQKRLHEIAPVINWRNVFLFAAGKCFAREDLQHLREKIRGICIDLNESEDSQTKAAHATLSGSQLALDLLEDGPARRQPLYAKGLARLALRLLELPPALHNTRIANLYASTLESVYREELEMKLRSTPPLQLGAWACLICLEEEEIRWAEDMVDAYWPTNEGERINVLRAAEEVGKLPFVIGKLGDQLAGLASPGAFRRLDTVPVRLPSGEKVDNALYIRMLTQRTFTWLHQHIEVSKPNQAWVAAGAVRGFLEDWLLPNIEVFTPNPGWVAAGAATRFVEDPSKETLAKELRYMQQHYSLDVARGIANIALPWPLGAILNCVSSQEDLAEAAIRAGRGKFGDTETWQAAETRWLRDGVTATDIEHAQVRWGFDENIDHVGFPNSLISNVLTPEAVIFLMPVLRDLFSRKEAVDIRQSLAGTIVQALTVCAFYGQSRRRVRLLSGSSAIPHLDAGHFLAYHKLMNFNELRGVLQYVPPDQEIYLNVLEVVDREGTSDEELIDFLDQFGREDRAVKAFAHAAPGKIDLSLILSTAFTSNPSRIGILNLLAAMVRDGAAHSIPMMVLDPKDYGEPHFREAILILRLAHIDLDQAETLAAYTIDVAQKRPNVYDHVLDAITAQKLNGPAIELFLWELDKALPITLWQTRKRLIEILGDSLRHRTSSLRELWSQLGLPQHLNNLIGV